MQERPKHSLQRILLLLFIYLFDKIFLGDNILKCSLGPNFLIGYRIVRSDVARRVNAA